MLEKTRLEHFGLDPQAAQTRLTAEFDAFEAVQTSLQDRWAEPLRPDAWSPAQIFEHVLKTNTSMSKVLYLLRRDAPLPDVPKKPGRLENGKAQSPAFALPGEPQPLSNLLPKWQAMRARFGQEVAKTETWHGRTMFHPLFGELDAQNWVQAASLHMAHHRKQLERELES